MKIMFSEIKRLILKREGLIEESEDYRRRHAKALADFSSEAVLGNIISVRDSLEESIKNIEQEIVELITQK